MTFDSFTDFRTLDRAGFGEGFLDHAAIDAIHVIPRDNLWYQHPEMLQAMACVHAATHGYDRVVTYGSSMGAYAAIRFAGLAGAHAVLALSPQYSIDPAIARWEHRWPESGRHFRNLWEGTLPFPKIPEAYVLFDPHNIDKRHVTLLARHFSFDAIALERSGHPVTGFLAEIRLLQPLILSVCDTSFDRATFMAQVRAGQAQSAQYLIGVAEAVHRRHRPKRLALLQEAVRLAPESLAAICRLAIELRHARRYEEAFALHRRTLDMAPGHPNMLLQYGMTLEHAGALDAALAVQEELCATAVDAEIYQPRLAILHEKRHARVPHVPAGAFWRRLRAWRPGF